MIPFLIRDIGEAIFKPFVNDYNIAAIGFKVIYNILYT